MKFIGSILSCARAKFLPLTDYVIQPFLSVLVTRKASLFIPERGGVIVAAAVYDTGRMFDMEHFVEEDVLNKPLGHFA